MTRPAGAVEGLLADRYRLDERLAVGGMGEVWRATDVVLHRRVAVKTLRPEHVDDPDFRARFRAEAQHAARLSHPGVAAVYDFGELPGQAWLVMELVDGSPLSALLREQGRLGVDRTLDVVQQSANALQAAHAVGLVHRDVKPGNLLVCADGTVKVTDFGIATAADAVPLTRTGQVVGTAGYLSPEQAEGHPGTSATDLYALGVVAYECLAGVRPFVAQNPLAVLLAHVQAPPPPLPDDVPPAVRSLVSRLMAKDPADRPGSAAQVALEAGALRRRVAAPAVEHGESETRLLPVADPYPDERRADPPPAVPPRPPSSSASATSRTMQRWAVRATAVLLALLAVALGVRGAARDVAVVPDIAVGTPEAEASAVLVEAGLDPQAQRSASVGVPEGQVVAVRPPAGTELDEGAPVVLVVSSGPPLVRVDPDELVGLPAARAEELLAERGLVPRLVPDGTGTPVGTVSGVAPVGALERGTPVDLHVVPAPPAPDRTAAGNADQGGDAAAPAGRGEQGGGGDREDAAKDAAKEAEKQAEKAESVGKGEGKGGGKGEGEGKGKGEGKGEGKGGGKGEDAGKDGDG